MEGSYDKCQVWWSSAHPLSAVSRDFSTARYRNFPVVPHTVKNHMLECAASGTAGEGDEVEGWRNFRPLQPCSEQLLYTWVVALHCPTVSSCSGTTMRNWACSPCPPTAATPVDEVTCGNAAGRLQEPRARAECRLALGSICCPTGKPAQAALPGTAATEGRRSQNSP